MPLIQGACGNNISVAGKAQQFAAAATTRSQIINLAATHHFEFETYFFQTLTDDMQAAFIQWRE